MNGARIGNKTVNVTAFDNRVDRFNAEGVPGPAATQACEFGVCKVGRCDEGEAVRRREDEAARYDEAERRDEGEDVAERCDEARRDDAR